MSVKDLLTDLILDLVADADEGQLEAAYRALRPTARRPSQPPPPALSERPGSTRALVQRALERAGRPVPLATVEQLVRQEQPAVSKGSISGTLSKLADAGEVRRTGRPRSGVYELARRGRTA